MSKIHTDLKKLDAMTDEDIQRGIDADPDAAPDLGSPVKGIRKGRGKQKSPTKIQVTLRLSEDVIDHFKSSGPGWQTRVNAHLVRTIKRDGPTDRHLHVRRAASAKVPRLKAASASSKKRETAGRRTK